MTGQYPSNVNPVQPPYPQQYGYPQQYPPTPPKKGRTGSTIAIVALSLVMLSAACGIGYAVGASGKTTVATVDDAAGTAPTSTTKAATTAKAPAKAKIVLPALKGNGTKNTAKFTTGNDWTIHYSYDCASFGSKGNFQVLPGGGDLGGGIVNELARKGAGTEPVYDDPGSHYLTINSECSWTVSVTSP